MWWTHWEHVVSTLCELSTLIVCGEQTNFVWWTHHLGRFQWLHCLSLGSATARLLRSCIRIPLVHGCLSLVSFMCCRVEVPVTGRSLIHTSPTEYMCVALSLLKCNNNPLHLQWVGRKGSLLSKTERPELYVVNILMFPHYLRRNCKIVFIFTVSRIFYVFLTLYMK